MYLSSRGPCRDLGTLETMEACRHPTSQTHSQLSRGTSEEVDDPGQEKHDGKEGRRNQKQLAPNPRERTLEAALESSETLPEETV